MAKKFMFVCLGILALVVAFHLGAQYGEAHYVDHSTTGIVAVFTDPWDTLHVVLDNGEVYGRYSGWTLITELPLPISQVKFVIDAHTFFDIDDNRWGTNEDEEWVNYGPLGLTTQPTTWSSIKGEFAE